MLAGAVIDCQHGCARFVGDVADIETGVAPPVYRGGVDVRARRSVGGVGPQFDFFSIGSVIVVAVDIKHAGAPAVDFVAVEDAVAVAVLVAGVGAVLFFRQIVQPVVIAVGFVRITAVAGGGINFCAVFQTVAVAVAVERVGAIAPFIDIAETVEIRVVPGVKRTGGTGLREFPVVGQTVAVGVIVIGQHRETPSGNPRTRGPAVAVDNHRPVADNLDQAGFGDRIQIAGQFPGGLQVQRRDDGVQCPL